MAELQAAVERRVRRDVPVHPQHLIQPQLLDGALELVVELPRAARIGRVRHREHVQHPPPDRVDPVLRNDVVREASRPAGRRTARQPLREQVRVPEPDARSVRRHGLREIAVALERGRHRVVVDAAGIVARQDVLRPEEEQLVAVLVEVRARDQDRSAKRVGGVVVAVARLLAVGRHGAGRRGGVAAPPAVPAVRVEVLVALEVGKTPAEVPAAALGDDDDRRARRPAVFGLEVRRLDLDLGDRVERGRRVVVRVRAGVLVRDAVVREVEARLAVDRHAADRAPAWSVARRRVDDAGERLQRAHEIAAAQADVFNLRGRNRRRSFAALRLHAHRGRFDRDRFRETAHFEDHRRQRQALGRRQHEALLLVALEAGHRDFDVIRAGNQVRDHECAAGVSDGLAGDLCTGVTDRHGGARKDALLTVYHRAADLAGQGLGARHRRGAAQQRHSATIRTAVELRNFINFLPHESNVRRSLLLDSGRVKRCRADAAFRREERSQLDDSAE